MSGLMQRMRKVSEKVSEKMSGKMNRYMSMMTKSNSRIEQGTTGIMLINLLFFILLNAIPGLEESFLLSTDVDSIMDRPWTLATVFFSHKILLHLIVNMVLLLLFGFKLEKMTNTSILISLYALAGFIGSIVVIPVSFFIGDQYFIAGASAAVFGIVTTFAVMRPDTMVLRSKAKWWALALFIFNVISIVINPQTSIGSAAHIAGILLGLVFGFMLKNKEYVDAE